MNLELILKTNEQQNTFLETSKEDYAHDLVKAHGLEWKAGLKNAAEAFERAFLPQENLSHNLYTVYDKSLQQKVGGVWFTLNKATKKAYLYQIIIDEPYRRNGYGKATMQLLHNYCKQAGMKELGLSVFGYNEVAYGLYKNLGYNMIQTRMNKVL